MKHLVVLIVFLLFAISALVHAEPYNYFDTKALEWADPTRQPMTYEQYLARNPILPFQYELLYEPSSVSEDTLLFLIVVNGALYPQVDSSITRYITDLEAESFAPILYTSYGGTSAELKDSVLTTAYQRGAVGALLVGSLPTPWFELYHDFDNDGLPDDSVLHSFPCDLYYMDIDGVWGDTTGNQVYDLHEGNTAPEFWIGRLNASTLQGGEAALVNHYFAKNHAFRAGTLQLPTRALAYIDDDWSGGAPNWANAVQLTWDNTDLVNEINTTNANDFITRWEDNYQHLLVAVHSSPVVHAFKENWGQSWGYVEWQQIASGDPNFLFYNLFACSNCRFVEDNYCGGVYIFNDTYGINAIGSTKTGSMLYFEDYYGPLGAGETLGEALNFWFALHGNQPGAWMWARSWFYGMTNLGDPTLKIEPGIELISHAFIDDGSGFTIGDADSIPDAGEVIDLRLTFLNRSGSGYNNLTVTGRVQDSSAHFDDSTAFIATLAAGDSAVVSGYLLALDSSIPDNYILEVLFEIRDDQNRVWYQELEFAVRAEVLELLSYEWREITGNGNGRLDEGETIGLTFSLKNTGGNETWKENPILEPLTTGIIDTMFEGRYYFLLDSVIQLEEMAARFQTFPGGYAAAAALGFFGPTDDVVWEQFYLPGGEDINIYDMCHDAGLYSAYPLRQNYRNAWCVYQGRYVSPPGCYRFGEGIEYPAMSDGALELPMVNLLPNASLTFSHRYDIEAGYDGGIVEIWNGNYWSIIHPVGNYPGISVSNGSFPSVPCYNGLITEWETARFDLSAYSGCVKIRFRFGSDSGTQGEGWFIDDIHITSRQQEVGGAEVSGLPRTFSLIGASPNPFNSTTGIAFTLPREGHVKLSVYDITGREAAVLKDGLEQAGWKRFTWDASGVSSGIYLYRVQFEGESLAGKCVLLK